MGVLRLADSMLDFWVHRITEHPYCLVISSLGLEETARRVNRTLEAVRINQVTGEVMELELVKGQFLTGKPNPYEWQEAPDTHMIYCFRWVNE